MERCPRRARRSSTASSTRACIERLKHVACQRLRPRDLHRGRRAAQKAQRQVRLQGRLGHATSRPSTSAILTEQVFKQPRVRHRLSQGDQGVLYAPERRRQDRRRGGLPGARHRRDHRRQPARGASGRAREPHQGAGHESRPTTGGTATCAATAPAATRASASASSAW